MTETTEVKDQEAAAPAGPPKIADGVELIGVYDGSGYKIPPNIARRGDGQVVQLSPLLYAVAERCDGQKNYEQIADEVAESTDKAVNGENVEFLVDEKLRPLGVLKLADGSEPKLDRVNPFLALKFRTGLVPDRIVSAITRVFTFLYWPPILIAAVGAFLAFEYWLFFVHGIGNGVHQLLYQPALLFMVFGLLVLATAFHEIGHATACRYGGAAPGKIGVGLYIVWPAFYTDVTDAYRLGKWGRVRVDLGGLYFNSIFILLEAALYWYTGFEPLLIAILVQQLEMLHQFMPFVRLDGYYLVSDLVGVPDLFQRIKPILSSLRHANRDKDQAVAELKPRVRFAVTSWVLLVIPVIGLNLVLMVIHAPRLFGTAWDSLGKQTGMLTNQFSEGSYLPVAASALQIGALMLPVFGVAYMLFAVTRRLTVGAWQHSTGRPALRALYAVTGLLIAAGVGWIWYPNGDYAPIRENETWTLTAGVGSIRHVGSGRPGLTVADPAAAKNPFGASPDEAQTSPAPQPEAVLDDDPGDTSPTNPEDTSDIDPETEEDPFFDTGDSQSGTPAPSSPDAGSTPAPSASSAPQSTTAPQTSSAPAGDPQVIP